MAALSPTEAAIDSFTSLSLGKLLGAPVFLESDCKIAMLGVYET